MQGMFTTKNFVALLYPLWGGDQQPMIVSMRGRKPDNPKSRAKCDRLEQRLEPNAQGICGALTSVQKDNLVLEEKSVIQIGNANPSGKGLNGTVVSEEGLARTITVEKGEGQRICTKENSDLYRIRKLTPRECWRLMGFSDKDFEAAEKVNSNTQLYKEAGNSIPKPVLMAIFRQMNIKGVER